MPIEQKDLIEAAKLARKWLHATPVQERGRLALAMGVMVAIIVRDTSDSPERLINIIKKVSAAMLENRV